MTEITTVKSRGLSGGGDAARFLAPVAVMGVIFWFSAQIYDGHELAWWEPTARTLGHFGGFGLLALAWAWSLGPVTRRWLPLAAALSVAYAIGDEYHQRFVEGRSSSWEDVLIDCAGIACALLLARRNARARREA